MKRRVLEGKENVAMVHDAVKLWHENYNKITELIQSFSFAEYQKSCAPIGVTAWRSCNINYSVCCAVA